MRSRYSIRRRLRWPSRRSARARVFIEDSDASRYLLASRALTEAGYEVGPFCGGLHFHQEVYGEEKAPGCPLIERGGCSLLEEADVIVYRFGLESSANREILEEIGRKFPKRPVVVETTPSQLLEQHDLLEEYEVVVGPMTIQSLVSAVGTALGRPESRASAAPIA